RPFARVNRSSVNSHRLPPKIGFAVVWLEESSNRAVAVKRDECPCRAIEPGDGAVGSTNLLDAAADRRIAEGLREAEIFSPRDSPELCTVFLKMLIELSTRAESGARSTTTDG